MPPYAKWSSKQEDTDWPSEDPLHGQGAQMWLLRLSVHAKIQSDETRACSAHWPRVPLRHLPSALRVEPAAQGQSPGSRPQLKCHRATWPYGIQGYNDANGDNYGVNGANVDNDAIISAMPWCRNARMSDAMMPQCNDNDDVTTPQCHNANDNDDGE